MPALYTHYEFGNDVFRTLDKKISNKFINSKEVYQIFAQSFDVLYGMKTKNNNMSYYCHTHFVNDYFKNIILYIKKHDLYYYSDVLAYLYGSICHYVLDSTIHPFIYYYTGRYSYLYKNTYQYKGKHTYMEYMLDAILYQNKNNKDIRYAKLAKCYPKVEFHDVLNQCIHTVFQETFKFENMDKKIKKGYRNFRWLLKYYMTDRFGIKTNIMKLIDKTRIGKNKVFHHYTYYKKKLDLSVLNLEHEKWCYPVNKSMVYHYSFYDLYDIALEKARKLITEIDACLEDDEKLNNIFNLIGNDSYLTGVDWNKKTDMKYFKY